MNANEVLTNVQKYIEKLEAKKHAPGAYPRLRIKEVYEDLGIFDWWNENLSISQLKEMRKFLKTAIELGFKGYVCFKVGAAGCAHGMWAFKKESETGYSPDGACVFHSFRSGDNYWDYCNDEEKWHGDCSLNELKKLVQ